ncbi:MAG: phosphonate C-P lyase system protein PhnG [Cyanobacteria bacterium P01_H01_bin.162]
MVNSAASPARAAWIATLAKAPLALLEKCLRTLGPLPSYQLLRPPETGLAMVRGRSEGTGDPFNLGEMTLTRCVVQIVQSDHPAIAGFGYVAGRSHRHAELAALCDALLQHDDWAAGVHAQVLAPLQAAAQTQQAAAAAQTEATRVNFFTLKRGES